MSAEESAYANPTVAPPPEPAPPAAEARWTFRGYQLRPAEFSAALTQLYASEVGRANTWRTRLDATTYWAVLTTGAAIGFTFFGLAQPASVIILSTLLVTFFLGIEARRYRYYELWSYRVRLMETDFFAAMLVPPFAPNPEWAEGLAESLLQPDFPISRWEAWGRRFRHNYLWLFLILGLAWVLKIYLYPLPALSWMVFLARAALGPIPGWVMLGVGLSYNGLLFLIGFATTGLQQASGEVLPKYGQFKGVGQRGSTPTPTPGVANLASQLWAGRRFRARQQLLTFIITAKPKVVASQILKEIKRGVTGLHGEGMYTQQEREVLLVAVTATEIPRIKALVQTADPNAFIIVTPAHEVLGRGFKPLAL